MAGEDADTPDELEEVRRRKLERYQRLRAKARVGDSFPTEPIEATTSAAEQLVAKFPVAFLEFWAGWCRPCVRIRPIVDELAAEYWGDIAFARVSLDSSPEARDRFAVTVLPTMIVTQSGIEAARLQGATTRRRLEEFLEPFAKAQGPRGKAAGSSEPPGRVGGGG